MDLIKSCNTADFLSALISQPVALTKTADGKLVWLENGNSSAGLEHIMQPTDQFATKGISSDEKYDFYTFIPKETYLNKSVCLEHDIFRCSKSVASIYVSEQIKKIVEDNHWVGFAFYEQP